MNRVNSIRHWSAENYTRVVINLDRKAEYSYRLLRKDPSINKPRRFYVDIKDAQMGKDLKRSVPIDDGLLRMVRAGQYDKRTVRVVLDIKTIEDYKIFPLTGPDRIVIDILGKGARHGGKGPASVHGAKKEGRRSGKKGYEIRTIVIDPGHGGKDPGAIGKKGLKEKVVTLKVAKMLKKELSKRLDAKVLLTRKKDVYLSLDERTAIANTKEADLFVSIHANASPRRSASGIETYYLGSTQDKEAMRVAARENSSTTEEMNDILQFILRDLERSGNQKESIRLATSVQEELSRNLKKKYKGVKSNGVKGALFYVLVNCNMPSILVEVSFVSNPKEEKRLRSDKYLRAISKGIAAGIVKYINGNGPV